MLGFEWSNSIIWNNRGGEGRVWVVYKTAHAFVDDCVWCVFLRDKHC